MYSDLIPGLGSSPGEGNGSPLQSSCLENPMDGGVWWAMVHGVTKSQTRLSTHVYMCICIYIYTHTHIKGVPLRVVCNRENLEMTSVSSIGNA